MPRSIARAWPSSTIVAGRAAGARQPARDIPNRLLRRRQADPQQRPAGDPLQALERQRQVRAAPGADHRVDLVDDDGADGAQHAPAALRRQQQIQRLRRRHQDVRRLLQHGRALGRGGVAGSDGGGDARRREAGGCSQRHDAATRLGEILVDVRAQRLERRDVEDADFVRKRPAQPFLEQLVDGGEKRRQRLARSGRRRDERVPARADGRPAARCAAVGSPRVAENHR